LSSFLGSCALLLCGCAGGEGFKQAAAQFLAGGQRRVHGSARFLAGDLGDGSLEALRP